MSLTIKSNSALELLWENWKLEDVCRLEGYSGWSLSNVLDQIFDCEGKPKIKDDDDIEVTVDFDTKRESVESIKLKINGKEITLPD